MSRPEMDKNVCDETGEVARRNTFNGFSKGDYVIMSKVTGGYQISLLGF
jgi:hypothetical protein